MNRVFSLLLLLLLIDQNYDDRYQTRSSSSSSRSFSAVLCSSDDGDNRASATLESLFAGINEGFRHFSNVRYSLTRDYDDDDDDERREVSLNEEARVEEMNDGKRSTSIAMNDDDERNEKNDDEEDLNKQERTKKKKKKKKKKESLQLMRPEPVLPTLVVKKKKNSKEEKEIIVMNNENYKGYYCPDQKHDLCEDSDLPEKYHAIDAWTIDEAFRGIEPPETLPLSAFDSSFVPSAWRSLGPTKVIGEKILKDVLRKRKMGSGNGFRGSSSSSDDGDDYGRDMDDDGENAAAASGADFNDNNNNNKGDSDTTTTNNNLRWRFEDGFEGAMRVLTYHEPKIKRPATSQKYERNQYKGEEVMRIAIQQRFGDASQATDNLANSLAKSKASRSPMEVYIELVQLGNLLRARGDRENERGHADIVVDAFELAMIARKVARTENVEIFLFYGEFKMNLGEYKEAKKMLEQGVKEDPKNFALLFALGNVCGYLGKWKEAIDAFGKTVEIDPRNDRAKMAHDAAKANGKNSNNRMWASMILLFLAVNVSAAVIVYLIGFASKKDKQQKTESKKRK